MAVIAESGPRLVERPEIVNLQDADAKFKDVLSKQAVELDGQVHVLVHPFYHVSNRARNPEVDRYYKARKELVSRLLAASTPIIIFEEARMCAALPNRIGQSGTIFVVDTLPSSPNPKDSSWDEVADNLVSAGVSKIELGGSYLDFESRDMDKVGWLEDGFEFQEAIGSLKDGFDQLSAGHPDWLQGDLLPTMCVGEAGVELLKRGIEVHLSPVTLAPPQALKPTPTS